MHAVFYHIFPINLSSTAFRLTFRIPSLFYLFRSLLLLSVVLLQVSGLYPSWNFGVVRDLASWADSKEMSDVCWMTFCSVCLALGIAALTRGLEGHEQSNSSPFNLVGFVYVFVFVFRDVLIRYMDSLVMPFFCISTRCQWRMPTGVHHLVPTCTY